MEQIRAIDIKMEVDTNKRTITRHIQPETVYEAVQLLRRMATELEEETDLHEELHKIQCGYPDVHTPHSWIMEKVTHQARFYCLGIKTS